MGSWLESVFQAIRRRELDRIAAGYAVTAWLSVQAASIAFPAFDAPAWLLRWLIVALIIGFPATLISVWIVQKPEAERWRFAHFHGRNAVFVSVIALIAVLTLGELAWHWSSQLEPAVTATAPAGSIAVLPFDNMSGDARQKYFSEGMSAELINLLARNPGLRVAARTSSFYFEGKALDIRTIAQKLNVRAVLEGSVSTDGSKIHIDAELVNAADGFQIWSQSYDRPLSDVLALQSDIANAIAQALSPALTGSKPRTPRPTQIDPDVYRDYLQAQIYFDQRLTEGQTPESGAALSRAVALFRTVAARAPDFADGQAALANALLFVEDNTELNGEAEIALRRALSIDPDNPQALAAAVALATTTWDWNDMIANAEILLRTSPDTAVGAQGLALSYSVMDMRDQALVKYRQWAKLDPFSYPAWAKVAETYFAEARYAEAVAASDEALKIHPGDPVTSEYKCVSLATMGRIQEANVILTALSQPGIPPNLLAHCTFFVLLHSKGEAAAVAFVHKGLAAPNGLRLLGGPGDVGFMLSHAPQAFDESVSWYEKSFHPGGWGFSFYPGQSPPSAYFANPRWIALTKRPEYVKWSAARARAQTELLGNGP
jgi:adenylate cyclase